MGTLEQLLAKLEAPYEAGQCLEMTIRSFEEAWQIEGESLEIFLTRMRKKASYAFRGKTRTLFWDELSGSVSLELKMTLFAKNC